VRFLCRCGTGAVHYSVAGKTRILNEPGRVGLALDVVMYGRFGIHLREEYGIAARQPHHRVAPFAIWRHVNRNRGSRRREKHVGGHRRVYWQRVVAAGALIRSNE